MLPKLTRRGLLMMSGIGTAASFGASLTPSQSTASAAFGAASPAVSQYHLVPKYGKGDKDYFSFELIFTRLAPGGAILGKNHVLGYFLQEVIDLRGDGAPVFRVTRNHTHIALTDADGKQLLSRMADFAEGFTYEICFEDPFDFFPVNAPKWPHDIVGFLMFEETFLSQQFFQTAVTRRHGAVDQLTQPGMRVITPDSNKTALVGLPPEVAVKLTRTENTLEFVGIGKYREKAAAVLDYNVVYLLDIEALLGAKNGKGREVIHGTIWVSPENGKVLGGDLHGANFVAMPDSTGKLQPNDVLLDGTLERLSKQQYDTSIAG